MAKIKALISCAVTAQPICTFVFAYEKAGFQIRKSTGTLNHNKNKTKTNKEIAEEHYKMRVCVLSALVAFTTIEDQYMPTF